MRLQKEHGLALTFLRLTLELVGVFGLLRLRGGLPSPGDMARGALMFMIELCSVSGINKDW